MNHTTNYSLPQWEDTDAVKREDMNAAMSTIDAAMSGGRCYIKRTHLYEGNGKAGVNNKMVFTFPKRPMMYFIYGFDAFAIAFAGSAITVIGQDNGTATVSNDTMQGWDGATASFYNVRGKASLQANSNGVFYHVIALFSEPVD